MDNMAEWKTQAVNAHGELLFLIVAIDANTIVVLLKIMVSKIIMDSMAEWKQRQPMLMVSGGDQ